MDDLYDVIIIGGGPAGLAASIYASRADLKTIFLEKGAPGGKMVNTSTIENWPGDELIGGPELSLRMFNHAQKFGGKYKYGDVIKVNSINDELKEVHLKSGEVIKGKSVVVATGTVEKVPENVIGIKEYQHKGVSYCAICDGPLYRGLPSAIIGGGNSAAEEGSYLASVASKVYVIVRKDHMRAEKKAQKELLEKENVEVLYNTIVKSIHGDGKVEKIVISTNGEEKELVISSLYPYIGLVPSSGFLESMNVTNEHGFIEVNQNMETKVRNIFAAGDIVVKPVRQVSTAVSDGAIVGKIIANRLG